MADKVSQYEETVVGFVQKQRGCFVVLSEDQAFLSMLRSVLTKELALVAADLIIPVQEKEKLIKTIKNAEKLYMSPFLFI